MIERILPRMSALCRSYRSPAHDQAEACLQTTGEESALADYRKGWNLTLADYRKGWNLK